ncbi:hypothetical protein [Pseudoalteromonas rubra]|uniref:YncE family protein n=1 Tax=Pseudoalteromonas rubra TaxID=43658 RepID=UPI002DB736D0|nr:hypothetical protein [Pseudoalteromonas rubra]MEC4090391.1 hypothetical protein [Pseudoalteromonas rubra]
MKMTLKKTLLGIATLASSFVSAATSASNDYTLLEADPVNPISVSQKSGLVFALNIPDDHLEIFQPKDGKLTQCGSIKVGMRPVSLALVSETRHSASLWVVNQLSDSINIVDVALSDCSGRVVDTIATGDEPKDIILANTPVGKRLLVTMAHRGQNHPDPGARDGFDLVRTPTQNAQLDRPAGLADVVIYHPQTREAEQVINLTTTAPRAIALAPADAQGVHHQVYVAGYHTGNRTSVVAAETTRGAAIEHLHHLMEHGDVTEDANGLLVVTKPDIKMYGGTPAVKGIGRCMPDPRPAMQRRHELQLCAQTDQNHNLIAFLPQDTGRVTPECSCTDSSGQIQPVISQMVKYFDDPKVCGEYFDTSINGCWLDQDPAYSQEQTPVMAWNDLMKFTLPDEDVFALTFNEQGQLTEEHAFSGVGHILYDMATHPKSGAVYVVNQDANNMTRFEGFGHFANSTVRGRLAISQLSILDQDSVMVKDLNDHLQKEVHGNSWKRSLAFPVAIDITHKKDQRGRLADNQTLFIAALGSDKLAYVDTQDLDRDGAFNRHIKSLNLTNKRQNYDSAIMAGPVGLTIDHKRQRLYVMARFSNELIEVDIRRKKPKIIARHALHNPEPFLVQKGRSTLYNATEMSTNGAQACASCHIFGDSDSLAWDLSNPDASTINNYGPFVSPPQIGFVSDLAVDPWQTDPKRAAVNPDFRAIKGPMITQPLRGIANHGATHWRGDRVRRVQFTYGEQPDTGAFDERSSIIEFDEAVVGLLGSEQPLETNKFEYLADYLLKISYPPNPIRNLDNSLTELQQAGRAAFFGCVSMTDEQFANRQCIGTNGQLVDIDPQTDQCECYGNPVRYVMDRFSYVGELAEAWLDVEVADNALNDRNAVAQLQQRLSLLKMEAQIVGQLQTQPLSSLAFAGNQAANNYQAQVYNLIQLDQIQNWLAGHTYPKERVGLLGFIDFVQTLDAQHNTTVLADLLDQLSFTDMPTEQQAQFTDPTQVVSALETLWGDANISRRPVIDARLPAGQEQNILGTCAVRQTKNSCALRIADSLTTCQGCHVLDPHANAEFGVEKPGLFGTSGEYSFSNIPQVFKVPHLRNLYKRTGKFGQPYEFDMFVGQSVFGIYKGGFFDRNPQHEGASIRGYGYSHDGSADTLHRFAGLLDFLRRPAGTLGGDDVRGNPDAFDAFVPLNPQQCLTQVAHQANDFFAKLGADKSTLLPLALAASSGDKTAAKQVVETVLSSPAIHSDQRWQTIARGALHALQQQKPVTSALGAPIVEAVTASLVCPNPPSAEMMPLCFQLGSTLEYGEKDGVCYPSGLLEREAGEAFMMAFDTNLKPMVGRQLTLTSAPSETLLADFKAMTAAAAEGHCDLAGNNGFGGYVMTVAAAEAPLESIVETDVGTALTVSQLLANRVPATFVCYPPKPNQDEARRSVLDRDSDGIANALDQSMDRN